MSALARATPMMWLAFGTVLILPGCGESPGAEPAAAPPEVSVVTLRPAPRPYVRELPGRIAPTRIAEIRARVAGIVAERTFTQGADVKPGDVLYRIDPQPFEIEIDAAEAALARAQAVLEQAERQATRSQQLIRTQTVSQAQYDVAVATWRQAQADVSARQADLARARLDLDYASVRSPINGRVGRALVTEGAYVGKDEATHLATVQQLDPIYADFTQSVTELQQLRRDFATGALDAVAPEAVKVRLELDDGSIYRFPGKLLFSDASVDPSTGQVTLRGEFPNPNHELLPGMYVRVQIEQGIDADALAVPQQAIRRNDAGGSEVHLVRDDNRTAVQPVRLGRVVDEQWLVLDGLKPADRVVVEGFQKFAPGDVVRPVPWEQKLTTTASASVEMQKAGRAATTASTETR
jgi:membrane fusion protein (multidrug efflux system)